MILNPFQYNIKLLDISYYILYSYSNLHEVEMMILFIYEILSANNVFPR